MEFKLDENQRGKILSLGIVPKGNEEGFFSLLEAHLQESRILGIVPVNELSPS